MEIQERCRRYIYTNVKRVMLLNEIFPNFMDIVAKFGKSMTISIFTLTEVTVANYLVFGIAFVDNGR